MHASVKENVDDFITVKTRDREIIIRRLIKINLQLIWSVVGRKHNIVTS